MGWDVRESGKALRAWNDYLAMGSERSISKLLERYLSSPVSAPTVRVATLKKWSTVHGWQARLAAIAAEERAAIVARGIADKQNRVDAYNDVWDRLRRVITARQRKHPESDYAAAGVNSGLMVLTVKYQPGGGRTEEWAVDTGLLKELREYGKQAAVELGQWVEKVAPTDPSGQRPYAGLTDDEIDRQLADIRTKADG